MYEGPLGPTEGGAAVTIGPSGPSYMIPLWESVTHVSNAYGYEWTGHVFSRS